MYHKIKCFIVSIMGVLIIMLLFVIRKVHQEKISLLIHTLENITTKYESLQCSQVFSI